MAGHTTKNRFRFPFDSLHRLFREAIPEEELCAAQPSKKSADEALSCYQSFVRGVSRYALRPVVATTYQRRSLLLGDTTDRATFDTCLSYHLLTWERDALALRGGHADDAAILELKYRVALPVWAQEISSRYDLKPAGFSKFERALETFWEKLSGEEDGAALRLSDFGLIKDADCF